jgi:hypothetical protein
MLSTIIHQYNFNLTWAKRLVEDLEESQMTVTPCTGLENHPAFTLGHLANASALLLGRLGGKTEIPESWSAIFQRKGPGDPRLPTDEIELYPNKKQLLDELEKQHNFVINTLLKMDESQLKAKLTWRFSSYFPSTIDLIQFMCVSHEAMHLGQLSAWRRAMSLPSALAAL